MNTEVLTIAALTAILAKEGRQIIGPVSIGPEVAKEILATRNRRNRKVSKAHIDRLAGAMKRGEFKFTGDPIRFYPNGDLADGQHRLHAIILSGQTIETLIISRFDQLTVIDVERLPRKSADVMALGGIPDAEIVGPAILIAVPWLRSGVPHGSARPSTAECTAYYMENRDALIATVEFTKRVLSVNPGQSVLKAGQVAAVHYVALKNGEPREEFEQFLARMVAQSRREDEPEDSPTYAVSRILSNENDKDRRKQGLTENSKYAVVIEAYTLFRNHLRGVLRAHKAGRKGVFPSWPSAVAVMTKPMELAKAA